MDIGLTENGGRSRLEDDDDCSGLTSAFTGEDLWPGEGESDESDIDDEELSRRLLPLRKARLRPVVLLEVSDIESMRGSEAPGLEERSLDDDVTSLWSDALTVSPKKPKKRLTMTAEIYLSLILNVPALFDRLYSFLRREDVFMHRRVCRSFQRRYKKYEIKVHVNECLPAFLRYGASLKTPMAPTLRICIDGEVTQEGLALLGLIVSSNKVPGLEDIIVCSGEDVDSMLFASFFKACEAAPHDCQITTLDFAGSHLGDDAVRVLLKALRKGTFPLLQALRLPRCNLTFLSVRYLTETLAVRSSLRPAAGKKSPPICAPLTELNLARNELSEAVLHLFPLAPAAPPQASLARLDLSESCMEPEDLSPLSEHLRRLHLRCLTHLTLRDNPRLGDEPMAALFHALVPAPLTHPPQAASRRRPAAAKPEEPAPRVPPAQLVHVDVSNTNLGLATAHALCAAMRGQAMTQLQHLDLSFNLLAHDGLALLCDAMALHLCPQLAVLNLACNRLKDPGLHALCHCLADKGLPSLTSLDISINEIGGGIQHLAQVLNGRVCPGLRRLTLCGNIFELHVIIPLFSPSLRRAVAFT